MSMIYEDYFEIGFESRPGMVDLIEWAREEGYQLHGDWRYDVEENVLCPFWLAARPAWVDTYHNNGGPYAFAD